MVDELGCVAELLAIAHFTYKVLAFCTIVLAFAMLADAGSTALSAIVFATPMRTEAVAATLSARIILSSMRAKAAPTTLGASTLVLTMLAEGTAPALLAPGWSLPVLTLLTDVLLHLRHFCIQVLIGEYLFL